MKEIMKSIEGFRVIADMGKGFSEWDVIKFNGTIAMTLRIINFSLRAFLALN